MDNSIVPVDFTDDEILTAITRLVQSNGSMKLSRNFFDTRVQDGVVILRGNVSSVVGYDLLLDNLTTIDGVVAVDDNELYNDEALRLSISNVLPAGLRIRVLHGVVSVAGIPQTDVSLDEIRSQISQIHGVVSVNLDAVRI